MRSVPAVVLMIFLCAAVQCMPAQAAEPWAKTANFEPVQEFESIVIPNGEKPTEHTLTFPAVESKAERRVVLKFQARNHYSSPGGWNYWLGFVLNGNLLSDFTSSGTPRLINRDSEIKVDEGRVYGMPYWGSAGGMGTSLLIFFGPGGENIDKRVQTDREELYWYMVDITDLVNYRLLALDDLLAKNDPNTLTLRNNTLTRFLGGEERDIVLDNLAVGYISTDDWQERCARFLTHITPLTKPKAQLRGGGFNLLVGEGGSMHLEKDGEFCVFESTFSYPGSEIGYNALSEQPGVNQFAGWRPDVRLVGGRIQVRAHCGSYILERTVRLDGPRVRVSDKFTNTAGEPIGIIVKHSASSSKPFKSLLGGVPVTISHTRAENPTIFMESENSRLGVLIEDNAQRLQASMLTQPTRAIWKTEHLGLDAGKSYTMEWTLYTFGKDADYWTFINQVRNDWKVNFTIHGPWGFLNVQRNAALLNDAEALKAYLKRKNLKIVALAPWLDYDNLNEVTGEMLTREDYKALMQDAARKLRAADPNIWVTGCIESFPYAFSLETSKILFDRLPPDQQKDGYPPVPREIFDGIAEVTPEILEGGTVGPDGKYAIEFWHRGTIDQQGRRRMDEYIRMSALICHPALGNAMHLRLMDEARFLIKECDLDGLYIDCFTLAYYGYMDHMRFDYKAWDGHTVDIDPNTGRIARKYTDAGLVGGPARAELIEYVLKEGKCFAAHSYPVTGEEQSLAWFGFSEAEYQFEPLEIGTGEKPPLFYTMTSGHLGSPIGLGYRPERLRPHDTDNYAKIIMKTVITYLRHGGLTYHYITEIPQEGPGSGDYGPFNHMFPITPVELREGYVVGKERTVTAISGTYEWKNPRKPQVLVFDINGRETTGKVEIAKSESGWTVVLDIEDWENVAVIH